MRERFRPGGGLLAVRATALGALVCAIACDSDPSAPPDGFLTGTWGGAEAALIVDAEGARVELTCADGRIDGTIALVGGAFAGEGPWWPGPVPPGEPRTARYAGTVSGERLRLTITVDPGRTRIGPLSLVRDRAPAFPRCQ